ncbi:MAG: SPASM domain-containing protein, partial [Oscillospiraceae bacterium]
SCYYMIEADGSVYPCDFYVTDEWRIGNVKTDEWEQMTKTDTAKRFVEISRQVANECKTCEYYQLCRGGCRRNREPISLGHNNLNYLCPSFKAFFEYAKEDLTKVAHKFLR